MPFQIFKTQQHKVEVATGVVIMDSFYFFAIVLQEGRQAKWIEMADKISSVSHQPRLF